MTSTSAPADGSRARSAARTGASAPSITVTISAAAKLAERPAHVVSSTAQQAGLAALVGAFDPGATAAENAERLEAELEAIATGLVAEADRDDADGRYSRGDAVGFCDGELVAWGDPATTLEAVIAGFGAAEIVTVIEGAEAPVSAADLALDPSAGAEIEVMDGGQPTYWWLIAAQ